MNILIGNKNMSHSSLDSRSIFAQALEIKDIQGRNDYLSQACAGNALLRTEIEEMLQLHEQADGFMENPGAYAPTQLGETEPLTEKPGTLVGPYKLLQQIGEGGMGTVFMAEQEQPVRRKVALKIIKSGMDSKQVVARFEAERQALAMMDHINIAKVLDAGTTETGRPYFVMELVHGVPITEYCDANQLTQQQRLDLFIPVCQAIQHAHQKGIIHRDIKPSNILVTLYDDKPVPKVIDFGVAKAVEQRLTEKTLFTNYGTLVGTFEYMSPEQAELNAFGVDTRSDVYSLGVLLYELLTGTTPLEKTRLRTMAYGELVRIIKEEEPPRPSVRISSSGTLAKLAAARKTDASKLSSMVKGELDWIVMKCLEKDRTRRYEGASALARDVQRYLAGDPVEACLPTLGYRMQKSYRKHRTAILTAGAFAVVLLLASAVSLSFGVLAKQSERRAIVQEQLAVANAGEAIKQQEFAQEKLQEATEAKLDLEEERGKLIQRDYASAIRLAASALREPTLTAAREILEETQEDLRGWEWNYLYRKCQGRHLVELEDEDENTYFRNLSYSPDGTSIVAVAFSSPNQPDVRSDISRQVKIWDAESGKYRFTLCDLKSVLSAEFSPVDSQNILTAHGNALTVWDVTTRQPLLGLQEEKEFRFIEAKFSPDGKRIVASLLDAMKETYVITIYEIDNQAPPVSHKLMELHNYYSASLTFSSDGRWLLVQFFEEIEGRERRIAKIIDSVTGDELLTIPIEEYDRAPIPNGIRAVELSPDCSRLAVGYWDNSVRIWKVENKASRPVLVDNPISLAGDFGMLRGVVFSPESQRIVTADHETLTIWNSSTGDKLSVLGCPVVGIENVYFSPDGKRMLVHGFQHGARIYDADPEPDEVSIGMFPVDVLGTANFTSNGRSILATAIEMSGSNSAIVKVWNAETLETVYEKRIDADLHGRVRPTFSPNGRWLAWVDGNSATLYDVVTGQELEPIKDDTEKLSSPVFSPDESLLLLSNDDWTISAWDVKSRKVKFRIGEQHRDEKGSNRGYFTPDGTGILVEQLSENNSTIGALTLHSALDGRVLRTLELHEPIPYSRSLGAFSADGTRYVGCYKSSDSSLDGGRVWDVKTGAELCRFDVGGASTVGLSPDGKRIITAHRGIYNNFVRIWFADSGIEIIRLQGETLQYRPKHSACFSPDGDKVLVFCGRFATIWDGSPVTESRSK